MGYLLGIDTGGTYTDAVLLDEAATRVVASAKALTTRPDLARGIGAAIDAALAAGGIAAGEVALVSLSTTLATNALVEGQGGRVALVFIGFSAAELDRAGLAEALRGDPVIAVAGGHGHDGGDATPLDLAALEAGLAALPAGITGFAVAAAFATRNPAHERAARDLVRARTGLPVTCSHELSAGLNGPKRALTAVLNARLIGLIARLIAACEGHLARLGIAAPLMVVRGDGALVSAALARERPIETILSGPAASIEGARWLTGETDALVADIGGTTTDVALLRGGRPEIDPAGARVGGFRTMVEAVAMRTTGLGGDSEVTPGEGLGAGLRLGPRRLVPVSLLASDHPRLVHDALDRALAAEVSGEQDGRFAIPMWHGPPPPAAGPREEAILERLAAGPVRLGAAVRTRLEEAALNRLVARGEVMVSGVTPSDAAHVLGRLSAWDGAAAEKALALFARRRDASGERIAPDARTMAGRVIDQLTRQTVTCLLEAAFAEDRRDWDERPEALAAHPLTLAGLDGHAGIVRTTLCLGVPVVGLGASAPSYYGAVGARLGTRMVLPDHAGVANAIGAVVGQVAMHVEGTVTSPGAGRFVAHLPGGPKPFAEAGAAMAALEAALSDEAARRARAAGVEAARLSVERAIDEAEIEGQPVFIEGRLRVTARGRPRIATRAPD
ncbi:MAG: hydantoinase/oxoprolinase family protein [Rhodobacteraceae bacterium]|nr:hydantoinase/oxoprolinase family protein [Paracoccaceae bacterium]